MSGDTLPLGGIEKEPEREAERDDIFDAELVEQFYVTLRTIQQGIERNAPAPPPLAPTDAASSIRNRINSLFEFAQSWRNAYEIEQLQCHLIAGGQLDTEIARRFDEAEARKLNSAVALKALLGPPEKWHEISDEKKRAILHRVVNDLQWFYTQRFQRSRTARVLNQRVSKVFLAAFAVLLTVLIVQLASLPTATDTALPTSAGRQ